jgi:putative nucleotidyltransferase with HDIG domain
MALGLIYRLRPATLVDLQEQSIIVVLMLVWLLGAKFMIVPHDWLPYLYPLAAFGMLVTVLMDLRVGVVLTLVMMLFIHYLGGGNLVLVSYLGIGTLIGAVILGRAERLTAFLWAGLAIALSNLIVMAAYHAPYDTFAPPAVVQLQLLAMLNGGLAASVALIGYFVIGNLFGITTSLQLTELSRPTHPLLRQLLLKSPGTYHHTIVVSNMAERAAAAIGADAFLTRVGAYYHDIGKTVRPYFFTENIADGVSPHDKLDPYTSAQVIISHVTDGLDLADKYRLPPRIRDFIREHHGSSLVKFFFMKAQREAPDGERVDETAFRYPGPNPRSKETAILMLADTCEAAVRSIRPPNRDALRDLINKLIDERVASGELNECDLTFSELQTIKEVFLRVLEGVNHPRISYPDSIQRQAPPSTGEQRSRDNAPIPDNGATAQTVPGGVEEYSTDDDNVSVIIDN